MNDIKCKREGGRDGGREGDEREGTGEEGRKGKEERKRFSRWFYSHLTTQR